MEVKVRILPDSVARVAARLKQVAVQRGHGIQLVDAGLLVDPLAAGYTTLCLRGVVVKVLHLFLIEACHVDLNRLVWMKMTCVAKWRGIFTV